MNRRCSNEYVGNLRKLEVVKMAEKHFFAVHTFISDEARRKVLTPPEKIQQLWQGDIQIEELLKSSTSP